MVGSRHGARRPTVRAESVEVGAACGLSGVTLVNARGADDREPAQHVPRAVERRAVIERRRMTPAFARASPPYFTEQRAVIERRRICQLAPSAEE